VLLAPARGAVAKGFLELVAVCPPRIEAVVSTAAETGLEVQVEAAA